MSQPSRQQYLESKVFTASQPQLHMMLLDGAIRFGNQANDAWTEETDFATVDQSLERMFDIVEELLQGVASGVGAISKQLEEQYAFVYRELAGCRMNEDKARLESCLKLLTFQRETWKMASERLDTQPTAPAATPPHISMDTGLPSAGLSLEA